MLWRFLPYVVEVSSMCYGVCQEKKERFELSMLAAKKSIGDKLQRAYEAEYYDTQKKAFKTADAKNFMKNRLDVMEMDIVSGGMDDI